MKLWFAFLFNIIFLPHVVWAAACCGGGFASPSLISGDHKGQFTTTYSLIEVTIDSVDSRGIWNKWKDHQKVHTLRIEGAYLLSDRWQVGITIPVIQREKLQEQYTGLGDVSLSLGYELITDWDYNPYKPKMIVFTQLITPTGKSKTESEVGGLDSRGNGFWGLGAGFLMTKNFNAWDTFATAEVHRSFNKNVKSSSFVGQAQPGVGGSAGLGGGYNSKSWRLGASLVWFYEDPIDMENQSSNINIAGAFERFTTAIASVSYLVNDDWAMTFSYSDQTLFGSPINTSLGRGVMLLFQHRKPR